MFILPKFLWRLVIDYLSNDAIAKASTIDTRFDTIVDWQYIFIRSITAISIVEEYGILNHSNLFWKYAASNHIRCDDIGSMLDELDKVDYNESRFISHKVFVRAGIYTFTNISSKTYNFNKNPRSIELIGIDNPTIKSNSIHNQLNIDPPQFFTMSNLHFIGIQCNFVNGDWGYCDNHQKQLVITDCIFTDDILLCQ